MNIPEVLKNENAYQYAVRNGFVNTKLKLNHLSILRWITPEILDFQNAVKDFGILDKLNCTLEQAETALSNAAIERSSTIELNALSITETELRETVERINQALSQTT